MGEALLSGLLLAGAPKTDVIFAQRSDERATYISERYGISRKPLSTVAAADVVILAVKPKDIAEMCGEIKGHLRAGSALVSVAAGKTIEGIQSIVGPDIAVIRVMPNTPTSIGSGAAGISRGEGVSETQISFVKKFLEASGIVVEVPENLQSAITIVGAAGMLENSGKSARELRENVTSPNGTTFAALSKFNEMGLTQMVEAAMAASAKRSQELA